MHKPTEGNAEVKNWYEASYQRQSFQAQRLYPSEELLRFFGRHYFPLDVASRRKVKVLEAGCGSCSNLWMVAKEGFDAYGLDVSETAIELGRQMLVHWGVQAALNVGSITQLPYPDRFFDVVCDVVTSHCLSTNELETFLEEAQRTLKVGGRLFMLTLSVHSKAFTDPQPATRLDPFTLNGIFRKDSPYYGNFYPTRFSDPDSLQKSLQSHGLRVDAMELITRTYNRMSEPLQFISLEASKL